MEFCPENQRKPRRMPEMIHQLRKFIFIPIISCFPLTLSASGFIENKGQIAAGDGRPLSNVFFSADINGVKVLVTDKRLSYFFMKSIPLADADNKDATTKKHLGEYEWNRVDVTLKNA